MTLPDVKELSREELQNVILKMQEMLSEEQKQSLQKIMRECKKPDVDKTSQPGQTRMSQELVEEKMSQIQKWQEKIDEGEIYLNTEEYEDYSSGYWDADWITEYYDNQGLPSEKRAEDMYLYFSFSTFSKIHMEEIFHVGRENLKDTERYRTILE